MSSRDHPDWWRPMGGQNSQDSILERRSLVWNDNGVVAPDAPPANYTEVIFKGKFYTRGCRGMIEQLLIYCIRTGVGTLTLRYSPHPCLGPIGEVTITPGAAWAWVGVAIEEMWNYDSLFIWVYECDADVSWGYDAVQPYDGHWSQDLGATWEDMAIRPFIRVVYTGETPGDVPVSGIINNIRIPNASTEQKLEDKEITVNVETDLIDLHGAGYVDFIILVVTTVANSHLTRFFIYCDEVQAFGYTPADFNWWGLNDDTERMALPQFVEDEGCVMTISKRFEFRRRLRISARNTNNAVVVYAYAFPTLLR